MEHYLVPYFVIHAPAGLTFLYAVFTRKRKPGRANAHPPGDPAGISHHERKIRDILRHNRAGPDEGILSDGNTAQDRAVRTESRAFAHQRAAEFAHSLDFASRIEHIGENHGGAAKYVVFQGDPFINRDVILNLNAIANSDIRSDDNILADTAMLADP
jgi:hypothetical protein